MLLRIILRMELRMSDAQNVGADLLYGLEAIADFVGLTIPQTKHQIAISGWPTFKQGRIVCARRSTLAKHFAAQEAAAAAASRDA
ncbi:hypothetical protein M9978_16515 [Sphingomonas sp. MG17]|uniref:Uncharacterized protein n=1 Tax=Sphingomonas tagetis TaxID=2949092 RepID=A0A9X2HU49_9SPHN|nr:hypothetical protein [Sphingomonas tagetis]MCP3732030.1 hypothetical protein [Sphingomonas tagetis]